MSGFGSAVGSQIWLFCGCGQESAACCVFHGVVCGWSQVSRYVEDDLSVTDMDSLYSFHVGSDCETPSSYLRALELAAEVFEYASGIGQQLTFLDIGGGFPGSKTKDDLFFKMVDCINEGLDLFTKFPDLEVIAEPGEMTFFPFSARVPHFISTYSTTGRYFACSTHATAVNVIGKKILAPNDGTSSRSFMYYVNDGVYGSFNGVLYEHATPIPSILEVCSFLSHSCLLMIPIFYSGVNYLFLILIFRNELLASAT